MAFSTKHALLTLACGLLLASVADAAATRRLLQYSSTSSFNNRATNTLRAQAATSQAITEAVNSGANPAYTFNAGRVGSATSWAAAQPYQSTFNVVERSVGPGIWGGWGRRLLRQA